MDIQRTFNFCYRHRIHYLHQFLLLQGFPDSLVGVPELCFQFLHDVPEIRTIFNKVDDGVVAHQEDDMNEVIFF